MRNCSGRFELRDGLLFLKTEGLDGYSIVTSIIPEALSVNPREFFEQRESRKPSPSIRSATPEAAGSEEGCPRGLLE